MILLARCACSSARSINSSSRRRPARRPGGGPGAVGARDAADTILAEEDGVVVEADAALLAATVDHGRLVGHFDRNTFFNLNGAGTNLTRFDNRQLAINLFNWVAKRV